MGDMKTAEEKLLDAIMEQMTEEQRQKIHESIMAKYFASYQGRDGMISLGHHNAIILKDGDDND